MEKRAVLSEFLGTMLLVLFAVGAAVVAGQWIGTLGIALAFGFTLLALAYSIGPVSGCHVNPAVTLGFLLARRIDGRTAVSYWAAQFLGGIVGAALVLLLAKQIPGVQTSGKLGSNGWGDRSEVHINLFGAFLTEVVLTFLLVFVVLSVTHRLAVTGFDGHAGVGQPATERTLCGKAFLQCSRHGQRQRITAAPRIPLPTHQQRLRQLLRGGGPGLEHPFAHSCCMAQDR